MMDLNEDIAIVCAFRYALGRMTYVVDSVASEIERNIERISTKSLRLIKKEISDALVKNMAGMKMDGDRWHTCLVAINDELAERHRETTTMS